MGFEASVPGSRGRELRPRSGLVREAAVPGTLFVTVADARFELADHFLQCGAQGVIDGLSEDIRARGDEVSRDAESGTGFVPMLHENPGFVDLQRGEQYFDLLADERGEGW